LNVRPDECVIGFGIPLSEEGFRRQAQNPKGGDFIRSQRLTWEKHHYLFVDSCLKILPHLRRWGVKVVEELTLQALADVFSHPPAAIILFAHWRDSDGTVELADRLVAPEEIVGLVPKDFNRIMDLCVCHPRQLVMLLKQKCPDCLVKFTDTKATAVAWIYMYQAMFRILTTNTDYFQALADAFTHLTEPPRV
jgi:hypothetical protein